ncbi:FAMILY PROTEIN putative-RELATED [Salix purpurea]|uniref:FAMILY PROTEIN putative-RELATED n=1 Tax=Salix purpurea TaxID=77065 RepID=A0A9Q0ZEW7_SALPP|nr:FAMILY PROTEIN putative-RELATED [Salix purpurea]
MTSSSPSHLQVCFNSPTRKKSSPVDVVFGNDDFLSEILSHLPAKTVLKLKLISKKWLSIISHPSFAIRHSYLNPHTISGFLLNVSYHFKKPSSYRFVSIDGKSVVHVSPDFLLFDPDKPGSTYVSQSCNGLLLCSRRTRYSAERTKPTQYYVFNPTTRQFVVLTPPSGDGIRSNRLQLVFDPSKSPHYKVLCIHYFKSLLEIHVYSSETRIWKLSLKQENFDSLCVNLNNGVSWNGAIHWISPTGKGFCFLLDEQRLQAMPSPPLPDSWEANSFRYFGESGGKLHFIGLLTREQKPDTIAMDANVSPDLSDDKLTGSSSSNIGSQYVVVYAMEKGCSKWFVKYHLDVNAIAMAYPEISDQDPTGSPCFVIGSIFVSSFIDENNEEGPLLVINMPGEIISYSFKHRTFKNLFSFHPYKHYSCHALRFTETLSLV